MNKRLATLSLLLLQSLAFASHKELEFSKYATSVVDAFRLGAYEGLAAFHWSFGASCAHLMAIASDSAKDTSRLVVLDVNTLQIEREVAFPFEYNSTAFDEVTGRYFAVSRLNGFWYVYDHATEKRRAPIKRELRRRLMPEWMIANFPKWNVKYDDSALDLTFDRSGKRLLVNYASGNFAIHDLDASKLLMTSRGPLEHLAYPAARLLRFTHDGSQVIDVHGSGQGQVFSVTGDGPRSRFHTIYGMENRLPHVISSGYSDHFITIQEEDPEEHKYDSNWVEAHRRWEERYQPKGRSMPRLGKAFLERAIEVWKIEKETTGAIAVNRISQRFSPREDDYRPPMIFISKEEYLQGTLDGKVERVKFEPLEKLTTLYQQSGEITTIAHNEKTGRFASGTYDGEVVVGELDGEVKRRVILKGNREPIFRIVFSRDGKRLIVSTFNEKRSEGMETEAFLVDVEKVLK